MILSDQQKYIGNTALGLAGGAAAYIWCPKVVTRQYIRYVDKYGDKFTTQENNDIWDAGIKAYEKSPIKNKVEIIDFNKSNWEPIADKFVERHRNYIKDKNTLIGKLRAFFAQSEEELKEKFYVYAQGKNACYMPSTSQILVNREKKANALFHEMGHTMNNKGVGLGRFLAKTRGKGTKAVPFVFGISMLTPKDRDDSKITDPVYKALLLFKKYSGLIASACLVPLVAEEGLASIKGGKMAKGVLSPELYKKITKSNTRAFVAYALSAIMVGLGTTFANYVKDKITGPLPADSQMSFMN